MEILIDTFKLLTSVILDKIQNTMMMEWCSKFLIDTVNADRDTKLTTQPPTPIIRKMFSLSSFTLPHMVKNAGKNIHFPFVSILGNRIVPARYYVGKSCLMPTSGKESSLTPSHAPSGKESFLDLSCQL